MVFMLLLLLQVSWQRLTGMTICSSSIMNTPIMPGLPIKGMEHPSTGMRSNNSGLVNITGKPGGYVQHSLSYFKLDVQEHNGHNEPRRAQRILRRVLCGS